MLPMVCDHETDQSNTLGLNRRQVREIVHETLAAETSSLPVHFTSGKVHINMLQPDRVANRYRRRFDIADPTFQASTTGEGGVVSASPQWLDQVSEAYAGADRDAMFEKSRSGG